MSIKAKDFDGLLGKLELSDRQLKAHFKLYEGYVRKLNEIAELRSRTSRSETHYAYGKYSELLRREPAAYNGVVLHELYFENLAPAGTTRPDARTRRLIESSFGSVEHWVEDMKAAGSSAHGWALAVFDPFRRRLSTNLVYSEHDQGLFADCIIVCALDCWEHAYALDFGLEKPRYLEAFFENLNWEALSRRAAAAQKTPELLEASLS